MSTHDANMQLPYNLVNTAASEDQDQAHLYPFAAANEALAEVATADAAERQGRLRTLANAGKTALQGAIVTYEILPITNEGTRYAALAATAAATHNTLASAAVFGGTTLLIEGAGAWATSSLITKDTGHKVFDWLNEQTKKRIPEGVKISKPVEAGVALSLGTPVAMMAKQQGSPEREFEEVRRHGLLTAAWVAGVCAVEGAMISEGAINYDDPVKLGAALIGVGAFLAIPKWVKRAINKSSVESPQPDDEHTTVDSNVEPRYDLTPEEMSELEAELVAETLQRSGVEGMVATWISPTNKLANLIRMHEKSYFEEVSEVTAEDEEQTLFLAIVDTRPNAMRVVHGATITGISYDSQAKEFAIHPDMSDGMTGFYTVDSLIERENFTAQEFVDYYQERGINPAKCIAVETNFRIGERAEDFHGVGTADLSYLTFFDLLRENGAELNKAVVFASVNHASLSSFERVGIQFEPLMGRSDLDTEEAELGKESLPVAIDYDDNVAALLTALDIKLPQLFF